MQNNEKRSSEMRRKKEIKKSKGNLVCFKSNVCTTYKRGSYKQIENSTMWRRVIS
jgi:hypothetical protein